MDSATRAMFIGSFHLAGEDVGSAARQHSQRDAGVQHASRHLVQGAIAACSQNQIAAGVDLLPCLFAGGIRPRGADQLSVDILAARLSMLR